MMGIYLQERVVIRQGRIDEVTQIQNVFNHPCIIAALGGFTHEASIKQNVFSAKQRRPSLWVAEVDGVIAGACMAGGRTQSHLLKYGSIGVLEQYRRHRLASAMYLAMTVQGLVEGRRLFEDTIVGDNAYQFHVLPTLAIKQVGVLKHRTASGKDICLFQFDLMECAKDPASPSMLPVLMIMRSRVPRQYRIEATSNSYSDDLFEKNMEIINKSIPKFARTMKEMQSDIRTWEELTIHRIEDDPNVAREASKKQQKESTFL